MAYSTCNQTVAKHTTRTSTKRKNMSSKWTWSG